MKNSIILGVHWKNPTFRGRGGSRKNQYRWGVALKGELGQFTDLRGGGLARKSSVGGYPNAHYDTPYIISNAGFF